MSWSSLTQRHAILAHGVNAEHPSFFEEERERLHIHRDLLLFDEPLVKPRAAPRGKNVAEHLERVGVRIGFRRRAPGMQRGG